MYTCINIQFKPQIGRTPRIRRTRGFRVKNAPYTPEITVYARISLRKRKKIMIFKNPENQLMVFNICLVSITQKSQTTQPKYPLRRNYTVLRSTISFYAELLRNYAWLESPNTHYAEITQDYASQIPITQKLRRITQPKFILRRITQNYAGPKSITRKIFRVKGTYSSLGVFQIFWDTQSESRTSW